MAIRGGVRYKPDSYRTSLEATIANYDPAPEGGGHPTGEIVMIAQAVAYDDAAFGTSNPYQPGHPDTERHLVILYEEPITKALAPFAAMTQQQATAEWTTALEAFRDRVLPAGATLVKAIRAARTAPPILIG